MITFAGSLQAFCVVVALTTAFGGAMPACAGERDIERQRSLFKASLPAAELGDRSPIERLPAADRTLLEAYELWPDLESAYLRAGIRTADREAVEDFLARYGDLKPARELRYRYALELARRGEFDAYFAIYEARYAELGDPGLDCLALQAHIAAGDGREVVDRARKLWRVGRSQVAECDPVFDYLKAENLLTAGDFRARYELAIDARSFTLARWLGRSMEPRDVTGAQAWLDAQANPEDFLVANAADKADADQRARLAYAAERLTFRDPDRAQALWSRAASRQDFSDEQLGEVARHIALWSARDKLPAAAARLQSVPSAARDDEVWRWRARTSLYTGDWSAALEAMDGLSADEREREEWRYWRALAMRETGDAAAGLAELALLARERSYHGFLAADELEEPYTFGAVALVADDDAQSALERSPDVLRARELFFVGLDGRGRSEWDTAVAALPGDLKIQAAMLAHRWGWHSRAIATLAAVDAYDDLEMRYPLPYAEEFGRQASASGIPSTWALGIARSESLFMRDARSGAGAVGLMQLLPVTGKRVAQRLNMPYHGLDTLTDPVSNIRLGTAYLGEMTARFNGNRILATAAYNAGPERVAAWIPRQDPVDARIWIECIPYNETRAYVRRVLEAETIFHWRLTGDTRRLSQLLAAVQPAEPAERVASSSR